VSVLLVCGGLWCLLRGLFYVGVGLGKANENLITAVKIGTIAAFGLLGLLLHEAASVGWAVVAGGGVSGGGIAGAAGATGLEGAAAASSGPLLVGVGAALISVSYAYDRWHNVNCVAGEIRNPKRPLPVALMPAPRLEDATGWPDARLRLDHLAPRVLPNPQNAESDFLSLGNRPKHAAVADDLEVGLIQERSRPSQDGDSDDAPPGPGRPVPSADPLLVRYAARRCDANAAGDLRRVIGLERQHFGKKGNPGSGVPWRRAGGRQATGQGSAVESRELVQAR
jgi:hypothetical protein